MTYWPHKPADKTYQIQNQIQVAMPHYRSFCPPSYSYYVYHKTIIITILNSFNIKVYYKVVRLYCLKLKISITTNRLSSPF